MTHETKAGILVSCSFVCLVGVVVYTKWTEGDPEPKGTYVQTDGTQVQLPEEPTPAPPVAGSKSPDEIMSPAPALPWPGQGQLAVVPKVPELKPAQPGTESPIKQTGALGAGLPGFAPPAPSPAPAAPADKFPFSAPPAVHPTKDPRTELPFPLPVKETNVAAVPPPAKPGSEPPLARPFNASPANELKPATPGRSGGPSPAVIPTVEPAPLPGEAPLPPRLAPTAATPARPVPSSSSSPSGSPLVMPPPPPAVVAPTAPAVSAVPASGGSTPVPLRTIGSPPPSPEPSSGTPGANLLRPMGVPAPAATASARGLTPGVAPNRPLPAPPAADDAPEGNIRLGPIAAPAPGSNLVAQAPAPPSPSTTPTPAPSGKPMPPLGAPATADSPPIAVPVPSAAVAPVPPSVSAVESYDEETYLCKANDTFKSISMEHYHTDIYDRALLLFNRNHPRANDAIRQEPPVMQAGQPVYIPPLRILEKQYSAAIPNHTPLAPGTATPPPDGPEAASPRPGLPAAAAPGSAPPASGERQYRVRAGGEMLLAIAQRTLGNGDRWSEIWRMNGQQFNPKDPIPAGQVLKLPADAKVEAQDAP